MQIKLWWWANSRNSQVFNFAILLKSRKFEARENIVFYSNRLQAVSEQYVTASCALGVLMLLIRKNRQSL